MTQSPPTPSIQSYGHHNGGAKVPHSHKYESEFHSETHNRFDLWPPASEGHRYTYTMDRTLGAVVTGFSRGLLRDCEIFGNLRIT